MPEYYVCYTNRTNGADRNVAIYNVNSEEEARKKWTEQFNPYCYKVSIDFITTNRGDAEGFRRGW